MFDDLIPGGKAQPAGMFDDITPEAAKPGFIPTVKRTGGQMLTTLATSIDDITGPNKVTKSIKDTGQGIIDRNPAGINGIGDIVESPWLTAKEAVGQFVPQIGAAAAGGIAGAAAGKRIAGAPGAAVGGIVGGLAPIFSQEYGGIRQDQQEAGKNDIPRALGTAAIATGLERVGMGKFLHGFGGAAAKSIPGEIAKGVLKEGGTEAAQNVVEQVGAFKDPTTRENLADTAFAGAMGGIGGGVVSGGHAAVNKALAPSAAAPLPQVTDITPDAAAPVAPVTTNTVDAAVVPPVVPPLAGDPLRTAKLPEGGALSKAVNIGVEQEAAAADAGAPVAAPITGALAGVSADDAPHPETPIATAEAPKQNGSVDGGEQGPTPSASVTSSAATAPISPAPAAPKTGQSASTTPGSDVTKPAAPTFDPETGEILQPQRGSFPTRDGVEQYLSQQRLNGGTRMGKAIPVELPDKTFSFVREGEPGFIEAGRANAEALAAEKAKAKGEPVKTEKKPLIGLQKRRALAAKEKADAQPAVVPADAGVADAAADGRGDKLPRGESSVGRVATDATGADQPAAGVPAPSSRADAPVEPASASPAPVAKSGLRERREKAVAERKAAKVPRETNAPAATPEVQAPAPIEGKPIDKEWTAFAPDSGTKNIPRADMPQIKAVHRGAMTNFLNARGITHESVEMKATDLKPTQAEFSPDKVAKAAGFTDTDRSILVSSDNHVLDGHHQWLAKRDAGLPINVIRLNAPIDKLLAEVKEFPSATQAEGATKPTTLAERREKAKAEAAPAPEEPDFLTALFGTPADQAKAQANFEAGQQAKKAGVSRIRDAIKAGKDRAAASHDDWAGRTYKANKTQVELHGDGPSNQASMSIGSINESRRRNAMEALSQELKALDKMADALSTDSGAERVIANLQALMDKARAAVKSGNFPGRDERAMFEAMLLEDLKFRGPGGKGNVTSNGLSKAVLAALEPAATAEAAAPTPAPKSLKERRAKAKPAAEAKPEPVPAIPSEKPAGKASEPGKIDDFGEKLLGARKDYAAAYKDKMTEALGADILAEPLSKSWPDPDYAKMLEAGTDPQVVALVRAARDMIPTKPQSSWKVKGWAEMVKTLRGFSNSLVAGDIKLADVRAQMAKPEFARIAEKLRNAADLYEAVGHDASLKGIELQHGTYFTWKGVQQNPPLAMWSVNQRGKGFGGWGTDLASGKTREEAIAAFKAKERTAEPAKAAAASFDIYRRRGTDGYIIGKKVGREHIDLKKGLVDAKAARLYLAENQPELAAALAKYKETPFERKTENAPRIGDDHRNGAPVTPEVFADTFGFRGVQFGNYVEGSRRQSDLNESFDALMDLAAVLGVPPRALSLNGQLGLAFGARGKGGKDAAAAHYEPGTVVINLTKGSGPGSLGHEWWHAADNYFAKQGGDGAYMTGGAEGAKLRAEVRNAFMEIKKAVRAGELSKRSEVLDKRKSKPYWATPIEMSARSFESYVIAKLQDQSAANDYLANVVSKEAWDVSEQMRAAFLAGEKTEESYPYPTVDELPALRAAFDHFFQTVETKTDDAGNVAMFSRTKSPEAAAAKRIERTQNLVQSITSKWANSPTVTVLVDMADPRVPESVRNADATQKSQGAEGEPAAFVNGGKVYLVASQLKTDREAIEALHHEALGHLGLRGVFGTSLDGILDKMARLNASQVKLKAAQYGLNFDDPRQRRMAAEEVLAELAQRTPQVGWVKQAIAAVRGWLRENVSAFKDMKYSDADIAAKFLAPARDYIVKGSKDFADTQPMVKEADPHLRDEGGRFSRGLSDSPNPISGDGKFASASRAIDSLKSGEAPRAIMKALANTSKDNLGLGLQFLGRRQIVEIYGNRIEGLNQYNDEMQKYDAAKNDSASTADELVKNWAKVSDGDAMSDVMHDATRMGFDPAVSESATPEEAGLKKRFDALSPEAKQTYIAARDGYRDHWAKVQSAIEARIERSQMAGKEKRAMIDESRQQFQKAIQGVYFPLARFGDYYITVKDAGGKVLSSVRAESLNEAEKRRADLTRDFPDAKVSKVLKSAEYNAAQDSVSRGFIEKLFAMADSTALTGEDATIFKDSINQLYLSSLPDASWAKTGMHRKGTPGYSKDARRAFASNMFHGGYHLAKLEHGDILGDRISQMQKFVNGKKDDAAYDSVAAQRVVDEMVKRHDLAMNPPHNALASLLTAAGFMWHMGMSPASAVVNLSQNALVAYPMMGAKFGYAKTAKAFAKIGQETAQAKNDLRGKLSKDENAALDLAIKEGIIDVTQAHDLAGVAEGQQSQMGEGLSKFMKAASWMFHHAEKFNRQTTFIATYRLAREAGQAQDVAFATARKMTYDSHFDLSQGNRPRIMAGPAMRVLTLFKQFGQNLMFILARNAHQSLKGETPEVRKEARKVLAGLLTAHGLFAGAFGLPLVGMLLGLASALGGDDDEPWDAKTALRNYLADAVGKDVAEVLVHGIFRALIPADISSRVGLDSMLFRDIDTSLEPNKVWQSLVETILGPVVGIGVNVAKGANDMARGDFARGAESMVPKFISDPLKAMRFAREGAVDKTGVEILKDLTPAEIAARAIGFTPSRMSESYEGKNAVMSTKRELDQRRAGLLREFSKAVIDKDTEARDQAMQSIQKFNKAQPHDAITMQSMRSSVTTRQKNIAQAQDGIVLPKKQRGMAELGHFANTD